MTRPDVHRSTPSGRLLAWSYHRHSHRTIHEHLVADGFHTAVNARQRPADITQRDHAFLQRRAPRFHAALRSTLPIGGQTGRRRISTSEAGLSRPVERARAEISTGRV